MISRTAIAPTLAVVCVFTGFLGAQTPTSLVDYDSQVRPIFATKCFSCHSQEKRSGGLSLYTYEDVLNGGRNGGTVRPGKSADSLLLMRVTGETSPRMPLVERRLPSWRSLPFERGLIKARDGPQRLRRQRENGKHRSLWENQPFRLPSGQLGRNRLTGSRPRI